MLKEEEEVRNLCFKNLVQILSKRTIGMMQPSITGFGDEVNAVVLIGFKTVKEAQALCYALENIDSEKI